MKNLSFDVRGSTRWRAYYGVLENSYQTIFSLISGKLKVGGWDRVDRLKRVDSLKREFRSQFKAKLKDNLK